MDKKTIRLLALAERLMDEGIISFVWAPGLNGGYDRLPIAKDVMEELGLQQGQRVNSLILEAICDASKNHLEKLTEEYEQDEIEKQLDPNFDFRSMM